LYHEEQIKKLMKVILDKYNRGEDIESLYSELTEHWLEQAKYAQEQIDVVT
jgi:hypothetical protein